MNRARGGSLIELLVALAIMMVVGAGLFQFFVTSHLSHESVRVGNMAITDARQPIDIVADHIRNAQQYTTDNITYSVIHSATASSVTYYANEAGATVQYALSGGNLVRTDAGGATTVLSNVSSLTFKYLLSNSGTTYYFTALTEGDPSAFNLTERSRITVIEIAGSVTVDGYPRSFKTQIRLRNSPRKTKL